MRERYGCWTCFHCAGSNVCSIYGDITHHENDKNCKEFGLWSKVPYNYYRDEVGTMADFEEGLEVS